MNREEGDRVAWIDRRNEVFSISSFYYVIEPSSSIPFPIAII